MGWFPIPKRLSRWGLLWALATGTAADPALMVSVDESGGGLLLTGVCLRAGSGVPILVHPQRTANLELERTRGIRLFN